MVVSLFYIGQHPQREIAAFLGVPLTTVNNRLHDARRRLKKELTTMAKRKRQEKRPSRDEGFVSSIMDELVELRDRDIQLLLSEVDQRDLLIGLMGSGEDVRDKVLGSMSERVRNYLEGEMEVFQRQFAEMPGEQVEEIQRRIVAEMHRPRPGLSKRHLAWQEELAQRIRTVPSAQMNCDELRDLLLSLADVARHKGFLSLHPSAGKQLEALLRTGIRYIVDGNEGCLVEELLEAQMQALLRNQEIHYRMIIAAILATQRGEHPNLIAARPLSLYEPLALTDSPPSGTAAPRQRDASA